MAQFQLVSPYAAGRRSAAGDREARRGLAPGARAPDAARRHRLRQDVHHGQRHRPASSGPRSSCRTTRRWPPSSTRSSRTSSRTTPSTTSSATTTTTSPKPTSRSATSTSRRTPRSTRTSTACAWPRPAPWSAARTSIIVASVSCIYGLGSPERLQADDGPPRRRATSIDRDELLLQARRHPVRAQRHRLRARQVPRPRRRRRGLAGVRGVRPTASSCSATRSSGWPIINPAHRRRSSRRRRRCTSTRPSTSSRRRSASSGPSRGSSEELEERLEQLKEQGKLLEAQRLSARTPLRHRNAAWRSATAPASRTTPAALGPQARRAAVHADRLLPDGLPDGRRRVARHAAAGPRHVRRRPQPQDHARRARLPPAQRARQSAAAVRRVGEEARAAAVYMSATPGDVRAGAMSGGEVVEQVIRPDRPGRSGRRTSGRLAARCPICSSEIQQARRPRRADARHDADQAAGRGPVALTSEEQGLRASGCTRNSTPSSA